MTVHNKLVRDRIPEIIRANGEVPVTRTLSEDEFADALATKLVEEANEYLADRSVEELADVLEILRSLACLQGIEWAHVEQRRAVKAEERGQFNNRCWLIESNERG